MRTIHLPAIGTFDAWRDQARASLMTGQRPETLRWVMGADGGDLFDAPAAPAAPGGPPPNVPRAFVALARSVIWHRDPERFARLYALLWALRDRPALISDRGDAGIARLNDMAKAVRRDIHKMHAFVRFREIAEPVEGRRQFAAWFEPSHFTTEPGAAFFAKRFGDMDWAILTPDLSAHFRAGQLRFDAGQPKPPLPEDATEDLWRTYFRNIFNPARLKVNAMQAEMPRKYWKNLPEAALIPELIATAPARAREMALAMPTIAPPRAARVLDRLAETRTPAPVVGDRAAYLAELQGCTRCPLAQSATQAVPGEGPPDAALMIVGEQPGDHEDLAGRPFVGPAGQLFDRLAAQAGLDRSRAYVTNAVKHFKFQPRGKRRLHQSPERDEIDHCRWWLDMERRLIRPRLIVAMGGTATYSLTGDKSGLLARRGSVEPGPDDTPVLITLHPSYILRLPDEPARQKASDDLTADLARAVELVRQAA